MVTKKISFYFDFEAVDGVPKGSQLVGSKDGYLFFLDCGYLYVYLPSSLVYRCSYNTLSDKIIDSIIQAYVCK